MIEIRATTTTPETSRSRILDILSAHAESVGHPFSSSEICLEAFEGDAFAGGLIAKFGITWMFVELLAVEDAFRRRGLGRRLMEAAEKKASDKGFTGIWLDTFSFQAPEFYRDLGYTGFGRLDDHPPGQSRHFLYKRLDRS